MREREREWKRGRERERERERERGRQRIPSRLHAVSAEPPQGLDPMSHEITTGAKTNGQMLNWLSPPGAPGGFF